MLFLFPYFQESVAELVSLLKLKSLQLKEATKTMSEMKTSLDCSWTILQQSDSSQLQQLDAECQLSKRAQLLLAVSDQAAVKQPKKNKTKVNKHRQNHGSQKQPETGQHWLLE